MNKVIATGLLYTVVFTALAFGAVEPWAVAGFCLLVTALLALWAIQAIREKKFTLRLQPILLPMSLFVLYTAMQSIAFTGGDGFIKSLSMDVEATRTALPVIFLQFAAFVIALNFLNAPERLGRVIGFLTFYGLALAVFALVQYFTWDGKFYWMRPTKGAAFGPFVNRNHFAGYMEMLIPLPVAMMITRAIRKDLWPLYAFAALLMMVAVVVSLSRGGMVSTAAGLTFLAILKTRLPQTSREQPEDGTRAPLIFVKRAAAVLFIALLLVAGILWLGAEQVLHRTADTLDEASTTSQDNFLNRGWIWRDTWAMIRAHAISGGGIGAYETVFPAYRSNANTRLVVTHSHNDYLQVLADGGLIGGALALWFLILLFRAMWRGVQTRNKLLAGVALGCSAGVFSMLVHSFFDFNLQIPSNALLFLVLSAIIAHSSSQ